MKNPTVSRSENLTLTGEPPIDELGSDCRSVDRNQDLVTILPGL